MNNYILLCALGPDRPELLKRLTKRILDTGCNLEETSMAALGQETAVISLISGSWDAIAKLESALPRLEQHTDWRFMVRRTEARKREGAHLPYAVEVISADKPGIVHHLLEFFVVRGITIDNFTSGRFAANQTGTEMFTAHLSVGIPVDLHIAGVRDEFMEFCDGLNLDAIIEPIKN